MTLYEVLGVDPAASAAEIRRAYLDLARRHHPDVQGGRSSGEERMRQVNEAWAVLGDDRRRRDYDRDLAAERRQAWSPGTASPDFVPVDDGDDPEDPAAEHDVPYGDGSPVHRGLQVGPAALLVLGVVALAFGGLLQFGPLVALGLVGLVGGALAFVATPVYAILRSHRHTRE